MKHVSRQPSMCAFLVLAMCLATPIAFTQGKPGAVAVREGESVSLGGKVQGYTGASYLVHAEAGQKLHVSLQVLKGTTLFNVYAPGSAPGQEALFRGEVSGNVADLTATQAGEYRIDVHQMRSTARRGAVTTFSLTIALQK